MRMTGPKSYYEITASNNGMDISDDHTAQMHDEQRSNITGIGISQYTSQTETTL